MNPQLYRRYGFSLVGDGPCYVLAVERRGLAERAGLQPGDRLVELSGRDVGLASSHAVAAIFLQSKLSPPVVGVASGLRKVELIPRPSYGYGFILCGGYGGDAAVVASCDAEGPAFENGLRDGDVVLELNSKRMGLPDGVQSVLDHQRLGKIRLSIMPVASDRSNRLRRSGSGRSGHNEALDMGGHGGTGTNGSAAPISRVQRARQLRTKLDEVFGDYLEKKMAVVGVLKTYADDKDVEKFAEALDMLLTDPRQRDILIYLRPSVPAKDLGYFDETLGCSGPPPQPLSPRDRMHGSGSNPQQQPALLRQDSRASHVSSKEQQSLLYMRRIRVRRQRGHSLGLVLRGHGPVYVDSVVPQSPADVAGVLPGDCVLKVEGIDVRSMTHQDLVHLLQNCSDELLCEVVQNISRRSTVSPQYHEREVGHADLTDFSAAISTISSRNSDWTVMMDMLQDDEGRQIFKEKAHYLLTKKERSTMKKLIKDYQTTRDVVVLTEKLSEVLDSPAKLALWLFIIPSLPADHHQYVLDRVPFSQDLLEDYRQSGFRVSEDIELGAASTGYFSKLPRTASTAISDVSQGETNSILSEMAQNAGHENGKSAAQSFQQRLDFHLTSRESQELMKALQLYYRNGNIENLVEDACVILDTPSKRSLWMHLLAFMPVDHGAYVIQKLDMPSSYGRTGLSTALVGAEMSGAKQRAGRDCDVPGCSGNNCQHGIGDPFSFGELRDWIAENDDGATMNSDHHSDIGAHLVDRRNASAEQRHDDALDVSFVADHLSGMAPGETIAFPQELNGSYQFGRSNSTHGPHGKRPARQIWPPSVAVNGTEDAVADSYDSDQLNGSDASLRNRMQLALQAIDDVMASEDAKRTPNDSNPLLAASPPPKPQRSIEPAPTPPPPPPPLPPPLPPLNGLLNVTANKGALQVKRINWEVHKPDNIQQTVWARNGDGGWEYFQDMVKYLELDQQFTTIRKPVAPAPQRKKRRAQVLSDKKAYNTSIILAHLKTGIHELKRALLAVDEKLLTPELTSQLAHYAPDESEVEHYASYTGRVDELCHVDRFAYEMSRIPGYSTRLRAILFKSEFDEKCKTVQQQLRVIRMAAQEVHNSKKLARLLELVLAMGNHLNRGTRQENASAFRITSLAQLDATKTVDKKLSFIHILAKAVSTSVPELLALKEDVSSLPEAARILSSGSFEQMSKEITEVDRVLHETSSAIGSLDAAEKHFSDDDRFEEVMSHFVSSATDELQRLKSQLQSTREEYEKMATYLGEKPESQEGKAIFPHLSTFIAKFEQAHRYNVMQKLV